MLALNPQDRLTLPEIKAHPWYNGSVLPAEAVQEHLRVRNEKIHKAADIAARAKAERATKT
jgi:hypothetical protein